MPSTCYAVVTIGNGQRGSHFGGLDSLFGAAKLIGGGGWIVRDKAHDAILGRNVSVETEQRPLDRSEVVVLVVPTA